MASPKPKRRARARPGHPYLAGSPLLIAHRGGAGLAPENTLAAFENSVHRWGADMLEMDVRSTRDGEVVVLHDATVDRTTDGTGRVRDLTYQQVQELDAGYHFRDPDGRRSFRGRGVRVPRFEDVLTALPGVRMNVEAKDPHSAPGLVDAVLRHEAQDRVLVAAEVEGHRRSVRGYPGPWGASRKDLFQFFFLIHSPLGRHFTPACDALQIPEFYFGARVLSPRFMEEAHSRNLPIHVWTVDAPDDMRRLVEMGVDGIQTDRPDLLAEVLTDVVGRPRPPGSGPSQQPSE
ncbi:MAG: glycerophosphodiester phosphodiesterase, partial [Gemmatimonadetes bacterium]|nr:glycerophosphodiester phosphodiesterase [Gemmatimonadota bacterium]NNM03891.1 glycerophosphodiester phosphodiesterase [Gemmatimonadota bacterium]